MFNLSVGVEASGVARVGYSEAGGFVAGPLCAPTETDPQLFFKLWQVLVIRCYPTRKLLTLVLAFAGCSSPAESRVR